MKSYKIVHKDGQITYIACDMVRAERPIRISFDLDEGFDATPFQTADAGHRLDIAAALVLHYTDRESCAQDDEHDCDCAERIASIEEQERGE